MPNKLTLKKLKKGSILRPEFASLTDNNEIEFSPQKIAVIYGPNGTGKTTIANIFLGENQTEFEAEYCGKRCNSPRTLFHVIRDQNSRNVISGATEEFILGDNIKKERQLKSELDEEFQKVINQMRDILKNEFKINKKSAAFIQEIRQENIRNLVSIIAKIGSKITDISVEEFINSLTKGVSYNVPDYEEDKFNFVFEDMKDSEEKSVIKKMYSVEVDQLQKVEEFRVLDRNDVAINILNKYRDVSSCIVCEAQNINHESLISIKYEKNTRILNSMNETVKKIMEGIILEVKEKDPFEIKKVLTETIETGNIKGFEGLKNQFNIYINICEQYLIKKISECFRSSKLISMVQEYQNMIASKLALEEEDEMFIQNIIADSLGKEVNLDRDNEKNIIIKLEDTNLLGTLREDLHLSAGEQNFISLAFELLKAQKVLPAIIVLDDPISSFDSIFKNKVAYCIIKILENKDKIIFTHNLDLVRLLDVQYTHCFNLYILSNDESCSCGFIKIQNQERDILLYLDKLLDLLRSDIIKNETLDEKICILSLVPFMRGISKLLYPKGNNKYNEELTKLMHGYNLDVVDITPIYNKIFCKNINVHYRISAQDIIALDIDSANPLRDTNYPLLSSALKHTLIYLYLRLNVEKTLCDKFPEKTRGHQLLGDIIRVALDSHDYIKERTQLMAKKTLLNEFNHYEGNMNIFQPAIDITKSKLIKEQSDTLGILESIKNRP